MSFMRAVRLVRVFRVFKFGRYSIGIQIFLGAIKNSLVSLSILAFLMLIAMVLFASAMYYAEFGQPEYIEKYGPNWRTDGPYSSIPACFWWAIVTMTTVGYGDTFPVSPSGKMVATACMVCGIIILALPISVLGSNFNKMVDAYAEDTATVNDIDMDGSNFIDSTELRLWLLDQKNCGKIPKGKTGVTVEDLLRLYATDGDDGLTKEQFTKMAHELAEFEEGPTTSVLLEHIMIMQETLGKLQGQMEALTTTQNMLCQQLQALGGAGVPTSQMRTDCNATGAVGAIASDTAFVTEQPPLPQQQLTAKAPPSQTQVQHAQPNMATTVVPMQQAQGEHTEQATSTDLDHNTQIVGIPPSQETQLGPLVGVIPRHPSIGPHQATISQLPPISKVPGPLTVIDATPQAAQQ